MKIGFLVLLSLSLAWSAFFKAGVWPSDWQVTLIGIAAASSAYWIFSSSSGRAPQLPSWMLWPIFVLPAYLVFQLIPLPLNILRALSPARADLLANLAPVVAGIHLAPLSVNPPAALLHLFTFLGYILTFFLVRELTWRFASNPWVVCIPLIVIASFEAILGLLQLFANLPAGEPSGTYTNHDHFSGLLEMILPLACLYGWAIFRRKTSESHLLPGLAACAVWALAALLFAAIIYSLSRTGFVVALCTLLFVGVMLFSRHGSSRAWRLYSLPAIAIVVLVMMFVFPPNQLLQRFANLSSGDALSADIRLHLWKETLPLISEYRLFGCGLGGYESVFLKYQAVSNSFRAEFAHNDYLQFLAELGLVGAAIVAIFLFNLLRGIIGAVIHSGDEDVRLLAIACAAAFLAIGLHSFVDFNLYVPANAMTLAWVAGVASFTGSGLVPIASTRQFP